MVAPLVDENLPVLLLRRSDQGVAAVLEFNLYLIARVFLLAVCRFLGGVNFIGAYGCFERDQLGFHCGVRGWKNCGAFGAVGHGDCGKAAEAWSSLCLGVR